MYLLYIFPPELHTFRCSNFFNAPKRNYFDCAANREIGKAKDLSVGWDFGYRGHYWPIVPAPGDR
jgi:hypothetical protein